MATGSPRTESRWRLRMWPQGARGWLAVAIALSPAAVVAAGAAGLPWLAWALAVLCVPVLLVLLGAGWAIVEALHVLGVDAFHPAALGVIGLGVGLIYIAAAHGWAWLLTQAAALVARLFRRRREREGGGPAQVNG